MHACLRPTEAACFRVRKCANNRQLIVAGIQRILQYAYAARFRFIHTHKTLHALRTYMQTVIVVFFVHRNGNMQCMRVFHDDKICLTLMDAIFKRS